VQRSVSARTGTDPARPIPRPGAFLAVVAGILATAALGGPNVHAQADSTPAVDREVSPASPRAAIERFLTLGRKGQFVEAASYLDLADSARPRGSRLARRLKAVLDRHLWIDLDRVSPRAVGDTTDGLPPMVDQLGTVRGPDRVPVPIRLVRSTSDGDSGWRFARGTVNMVPALYGTLKDRWIIERLPEMLTRPGPFDLLWWQWITLPLLLVAAWAIGTVASRVALAVLSRIVANTRTEWDDAILTRVGAPLTGALTLGAAALLLPWLALYPPAAETGSGLIKVGLYVVFFWSLWRLVDVVRQVLSSTAWAQASRSSRALLPLGARVAKILVLAVTVVAVISSLGYPVTSLVAGFGLGGLAVALAAQKTVENLFGAFSIGVDQPFREGDFVKVEEFVGTVEAIGLRSTRFRTLDRTLISIPNARLADMRLESFTARDRLRLATVIGLVYETTATQMREVLDGFERVLRGHPKIWPDAVVVRFREFGPSSLDIEVMAWFQTADWSEFQLIRQEVLLAMMAVVEAAGSSFAFPTQTIHLGAGALTPLRDLGRSGPAPPNVATARA